MASWQPGTLKFGISAKFYRIFSLLDLYTMDFDHVYARAKAPIFCKFCPIHDNHGFQEFRQTMGSRVIESGKCQKPYQLALQQGGKSRTI